LKTRLGSIAVLLALLMLLPAGVSYANDQERISQIEKLIELAELTEEKTEILINITYLEKTTIDTIVEAGLKDELDAIVREFNNAVPNIISARESLAHGDSEGAVASLIHVLEIFREVNREIDRILTESGVQGGELVDPQDTIQAMKDALERIERLEEVEDLPAEILWLLGKARPYLNATQAVGWLQLGMVDETAHNLTEANMLISEAYQLLDEEAVGIIDERMQNYFVIIEELCGRLEQDINEAMKKWPEAQALKTRLENEVYPAIDEAKKLFGPGGPDKTLFLEAVVGRLQEAREVLRQIEEDLKELPTHGDDV